MLLRYAWTFLDRLLAVSAARLGQQQALPVSSVLLSGCRVVDGPTDPRGQPDHRHRVKGRTRCGYTLSVFD